MNITDTHLIKNTQKSSLFFNLVKRQSYFIFHIIKIETLIIDTLNNNKQFLCTVKALNEASVMFFNAIGKPSIVSSKSIDLGTRFF